MKKITLIFDAQFVGREETTIEVKDNITEEEIKQLFPTYLGVEYDESCYYVVKE